MRDIHIAAHDDRLILVQTAQIVAEGVLPPHTVIQPLEAVLRIRRVDRDQIKFAVVRRDDAALMVVLVDAETERHRLRLGLCEERHARVTLFLRRVPVFVIAALERHIRLPLLHFCLLQTQHIRLLLRDKLQKALAHARAQAVHIP